MNIINKKIITKAQIIKMCLLITIKYINNEKTQTKQWNKCLIRPSIKLFYVKYLLKNVIGS